MATKLHVLRWYFEQLKLARGLSILTIGVAITASVLLDVVTPFIVATLFELRASGAEFGELYKLLVALGACVLGGVILGPRRMALRRKLHNIGYTGLTEKIQKIVTASPSVGRKIDRSAKKQFLDTWEDFTYALIDQFVPFVVGVGGLVVILLFKASFVVVPVILVLVGTVLLARRVGDVMGSTWSDFREREHTELGILNGLVTSAQMLWLVDMLGFLLRKADAARSAALHVYIKAMTRYQTIMAGLSHGFKLTAISGGIILGTLFGADLGVTTLLLVYGLVLGDRMTTIFNINDMLTSSAVDAEPLVRALEEAKPLGSELRAVTSVVEVKEKTTVKYRSEDAEARARAEGRPPPEPTIVGLPAVTIHPGITQVIGPSGWGKTTLLRALNGLPYDGSITLGGIELSGNDPRARVIFGEQSFEPLEKTEVVDLFGGEHAKREIVDQALWCAGYPEADLNRKIDDGHSGGQLKRLMLAAQFYPTLLRDRTLASVLGMDEPTNHLDPMSVRRLLKGIRWIADNDCGLTVIIVTHDSRVEEIADATIDFGEM